MGRMLALSSTHNSHNLQPNGHEGSILASDGNMSRRLGRVESHINFGNNNGDYDENKLM